MFLWNIKLPALRDVELKTWCNLWNGFQTSWSSTLSATLRHTIMKPLSLSKGILLNSNKQPTAGKRLFNSRSQQCFITIGWKINKRPTQASNWFPKIAEKLSQGSTFAERCIQIPYGNTSFKLQINSHFKQFIIHSSASSDLPFFFFLNTKCARISHSGIKMTLQIGSNKSTFGLHWKKYWNTHKIDFFKIHETGNNALSVSTIMWISFNCY